MLFVHLETARMRRCRCLSTGTRQPDSSGGDEAAILLPGGAAVKRGGVCTVVDRETGSSAGRHHRSVAVLCSPVGRWRALADDRGGGEDIAAGNDFPRGADRVWGTGDLL